MEWGLSFWWQEEDVQERFEQMQETMLPACPASVPFYKAKMRTDQKVISGGGAVPYTLANACRESDSASLPGGV